MNTARRCRTLHILTAANNLQRKRESTWGSLAAAEAIPKDSLAFSCSCWTMSSAVMGNDSASSSKNCGYALFNSGGCSDGDGTASNHAGAKARVAGVTRPSGVALESRETRTTSSPTGEALNYDDDNAFELREWAEKWLEKKHPRVTQRSSQDRYTPYDANRNKGIIPHKHFEEAFEEFWSRFMDVTSSSYTSTEPSMVLVATGVHKDWTPPEALRKAKFLFFPSLRWGGTTTSALFITYMPGKEHGAADACVNDSIGTWIRSNGLHAVLNSGLSSGDYARPQPDRRIFPKSQFRDGHGDTDQDNGGTPLSRFIWEVEYKNRNPIDMRKNGKRLMRSPYNRLYLAAKIYETDPVDGHTEAVIVLWGRTPGNDDKVEVIEAVSFGTKDLSDEHKDEFSGHETRTSLVGVGISDWRRPQVFPPHYPQFQNPLDPEQTPEEFLLDIPLEGILHKVLIPSDSEDTPQYLNELRENGARAVSNLKIDLRVLLSDVLDVAGNAPSAPTAGSTTAAVAAPPTKKQRTKR